MFEVAASEAGGLGSIPGCSNSDVVGGTICRQCFVSKRTTFLLRVGGMGTCSFFTLLKVRDFTAVAFRYIYI